MRISYPGTRATLDCKYACPGLVSLLQYLDNPATPITHLEIKIPVVGEADLKALSRSRHSNTICSLTISDNPPAWDATVVQLSFWGAAWACLPQMRELVLGDEVLVEEGDALAACVAQFCAQVPHTCTVAGVSLRGGHELKAKLEAMLAGQAERRVCMELGLRPSHAVRQLHV